MSCHYAYFILLLQLQSIVNMASNTTIIDNQDQFDHFYSQTTESKDNNNSQIETLIITNAEVSNDQLENLRKHLINLKDLNYTIPAKEGVDDDDEEDSDEGACRCCRNDRYE